MGSIGQSRFVCQVWCSGIQGIYSQFKGGSIGQSGFICQFWCSSNPWIYSRFNGGSSAKVCSSAKFCVLVFKASMLYYWGVHLPKKVCLPNLSSFTFHALLHRRSFCVTYERPNKKKIIYKKTVHIRVIYKYDNISAITPVLPYLTIINL